MNINLLAEGLDGSLAEIVAKLQSLIDSFWIYIVIALAPSIVVSAVALAAGWVSGNPLGGCAVAVTHLAGCTGDWEYLRVIRANPRIAFCEDTSWGVAFYDENGPSRVEDEEVSVASEDAPASRAADMDASHRAE